MMAGMGACGGHMGAGWQPHGAKGILAAYERTRQEGIQRQQRQQCQQ